MRETIHAETRESYVHAAREIAPDFSVYIEAVHRLSDLGAVYTDVTHGTSQEGFEAEWRMIQLDTVEGDLINHSERFDEADIDAALARFDELHPQAARLENTANQVGERYLAQFAARDWDTMAEITLADDFSSDDRRRVVGAGVRRGRDAEIADMWAIADIGLTDARRTAGIATRGERLVLSRVRFSGREHGPDAVVTGRTQHRRDQRGQSDRGDDSCSTPTTPTPPSRSLTPGTSQAKRPPTRTRGRSSNGPFTAPLTATKNLLDGARLGEYRPPPSGHHSGPVN